MENNVCKICRRLGQKLFLKGEKCSSPKCPMVKKSYPPGTRKKRRRRGVSEYGKELSEKQRLKNYYNLRETQFRKYVREILKSRGKVEDIGLLLIKKLEKRLDNVIYRLGFAKSRRQAGQLVGHGYFLVNSKPVNIPSYEIKKGDKIFFRETKKKKVFLSNLVLSLKNYQTPSWLKLDRNKLVGEITEEPSGKDLEVPLDLSAIFEFYSR